MKYISTQHPTYLSVNCLFKVGTITNGEFLNNILKKKNMNGKKIGSGKVAKKKLNREVLIRDSRVTGNKHFFFRPNEYFINSYQAPYISVNINMVYYYVWVYVRRPRKTSLKLQI